MMQNGGRQGKWCSMCMCTCCVLACPPFTMLSLSSPRSSPPPPLPPVFFNPSLHHRVGQNNGGPAGQVVFHVHVHVLPRTEADGLLSFGKSGPMIAADEAKEVKEAIAAALPSHL
ncbi:unnamed protein product [Closterium sp. NIES-53]